MIDINLVKKLLDDHNISAYHISKETGVHGSSITAYRRGEREFENFPLKTILLLYDYAKKVY